MDNIQGLRDDTLKLMEFIVNPAPENKHDAILACRELFGYFDRKINSAAPIHEIVERPGGAQFIDVAWPYGTKGE